MIWLHPNPYDLDVQSAPSYGQGMATTLPADQSDDPVRELHKVVEEVTGKPVAVAAKPRMGFL